MEPEHLCSFNNYFWNACSMSGTVLDAGDTQTLTLPLWKSYTSSSEIYWKIVLQWLVGWITLSDTAALSAHSYLRCSRECCERGSQPEASWRKNCLKQLKKIYRAALVSPASSAKQEDNIKLERADVKSTKEVLISQLKQQPWALLQPCAEPQSRRSWSCNCPNFCLTINLPNTMCA